MLLNPYQLNRAALLFLLALTFAGLGIWWRSYAALSLFWPCNAILLGLLIRFPSLNTHLSFPAIYTAMVVADIAADTYWIAALGMDLANVLFIAVGRFILLSQRVSEARISRLNTLTRTFPAAVMASAICALVGGLTSAHYYHGDLLKAWFSWFCEQFSTCIMLLPLTIALPRRNELSSVIAGLQTQSPLPVLALLTSTALGVWAGGGASLLFPLPAMLWVAIRYPLFISCLLTTLTGISQIILVAGNILNIQSANDFFRLDSLASVRLGAAALTISPLIVALSTAVNRKLVARITRRADFDFLTGALTRSGLAQRLELKFNPREQSAVFTGAALLIDIDHFKKINDTWGHAAGDIILTKTVEAIRHMLHADALLSRMGGEEFLVLLEGMSLPRAAMMADLLRSTVEANQIMVNGMDLSVTVSIGVCTVSIDSVSELDNAIKPADQQLYLAKSGGRNQVSPPYAL